MFFTARILKWSFHVYYVFAQVALVEQSAKHYVSRSDSAIPSHFASFTAINAAQ